MNLNQSPIQFENHLDKTVSAINWMFTRNILNDVTVVSGDVEIPANKVVLAASSQYFYDVLKNDATTQHITVDSIDPRALSPVITYIYSSEITINDENVDYISSAAQELGMTDLCNICAHYTKSKNE